MTDSTSTLWRQLDLIEPSEVQPGIRLYPCSAQLNDGSVLECIYFIEPDAAKRLFGFERPEDVPGLAAISPSQVASISESPLRLPARFANQIYRAGESRMGCYIFTLVFSRWLRRGYLVGGFVDFLKFPWGRLPSGIKEVVLHRGAARPSPVKEFKWCVLTRY